jgi:hypothetical protein
MRAHAHTISLVTALVLTTAVVPVCCILEVHWLIAGVQEETRSCEGHDGGTSPAATTDGIALTALSLDTCAGTLALPISHRGPLPFQIDTATAVEKTFFPPFVAPRDGERAAEQPQPPRLNLLSPPRRI